MISNSNDIWFVLVGEQSYGPFTSDIMIGFVEEKRIVASSLMSIHPQQGYRPAADYPVFKQWIHASNPQPTHFAPNPSSIQRPTPSEAMSAQTLHPQITHVQVSSKEQQGETIYIVMAEINPKTGMNFLRKLQGFGHAQRVGDTVWLLKTGYNLSLIHI